MRNLLIFSTIALAAVCATGCQNLCGGGGSGGWYPGYHLFGQRNQTPAYAPAYAAAPVCCDPCASGGVVAAPVMQPVAAPCCQ